MVVYRPLAFCVGLACATLASWADAAPPPTATTRAERLAEIGHYRDQARWVDALAAIERAQLREPNDDLLYKLQVLTLGDIGNAHRAWRLYQARPNLFDQDQKARLEANYVAKLVNWSLAYGKPKTPGWTRPRRRWRKWSSTSSATAQRRRRRRCGSAWTG